MPGSPFDDSLLSEMRDVALRQAGGLYNNPSPQSDAMTALYLIAALTVRIAQLEADLAKATSE